MMNFYTDDSPGLKISPVSAGQEYADLNAFEGGRREGQSE
jgi:hypothetical protein